MTDRKYFKSETKTGLSCRIFSPSSKQKAAHHRYTSDQVTRVILILSASRISSESIFASQTTCSHSHTHTHTIGLNTGLRVFTFLLLPQSDFTKVRLWDLGFLFFLYRMQERMSCHRYGRVICLKETWNHMHSQTLRMLPCRETSQNSDWRLRTTGTRILSGKSRL